MLSAVGADEHVVVRLQAEPVGVLHYDQDYDLIAEKTDLAFDNIWLASRGTL